MHFFRMGVGEFLLLGCSDHFNPSLCYRRLSLCYHRPSLCYHRSWS
jgi:hypothetical protein